MSQAERTRVMNRFREGRTNVLVATDVASRGIDVDRVDLFCKTIYLQMMTHTSIVLAVLVVQDELDEASSWLETEPFVTSNESRRKPVVLSKSMYQHNKTSMTCNAQLVQQFNEIEPQQTAFDAFNAARESGMSAEKLPLLLFRNYWVHPLRQEPTSVPQVNKSDNGPKAALVLGLGAMDGIDRGAITGMVYRVGNLPDASVGRIEMLDKITAVELPEEYIDQLVQDLDQERVGRRYVRPRRSDDWTFQPEGRHPSQRRHGGGGRQGGGRKGPGGRHNSRGKGRSGRSKRRR